MGQSQRSNAAAVALISVVALCVVLPFARLGIPSGHDFEFHMNSWIEVVDHWKQGNFYPHWAAMAHYGYGEARFIFYPPFSWTLGAALGLLLPWKLVPAVYIWIVLTMAGCSMFFVARTWLSWADATFTAALYLANPYNLVIVYWRSAFAELMAAIYLPLLFWLLLRADEDYRRIVVPLSVLMAAGWLTNLPSAVMMNYSLAVLAAAVALKRRSFVALVYSGVAVIVGAALAGFYLLPAFHEQHWVEIGQVLGPGVRPSDNFLFTGTEDLDHNRFNLLVSMVAVSEIAIFAVSMVLWLRRGWHTTRKFAFIWGFICAVVMLRPTLALWNHLPELRFVQFPWRWLLCLNVPLALAAAFAIRRWWWRTAASAVMLAVLLSGWHRVQSPWWDSAADIKEMLDNQADRIGNEGTDEYVPAGADAYEIDKNAPLVFYEGKGSAQFSIQRWSPERREFTVNASAPGNLVLRLFNYPSWKVTVNGRLTESTTVGHTGQMVVPIDAAKNKVDIYFVKGWDDKAGMLISALSLMFIAAWFYSTKTSSLRSPGLPPTAPN